MDNIRFLFKGVEIDDRTNKYIRKRASSLQKFLDKVNQFEIEIDMNKKGKFRVELMVHTPRKLYRAEETTESIEGSIDLVVDQVERQIKKDKGKIWTKIVRGGRSIKKKFTIDKDARF